MFLLFGSDEMATLKKIWVEENEKGNSAIRIDWDNDRHQRVEIEGDTPESVSAALKEAGALVNAERVHGKI